MKSLICILITIAALASAFAQNPDISVQFSPAAIYVNTFRTASFDPETPWTQPILTTLQIANTSSTAYRFYMKVEIGWSGVSGPLVEAIYITADNLAAGANFYPLTNQDLITSQASVPFNQVGSISFSLDDIVSRSDILKQAVLAGYFPDGVISIRVQVQPENYGYSNWSNSDSSTFSIHVRSVGVITSLSPGALEGQTPSLLSDTPVTYFWNSLDTGLNQYRILIKEFPANDPPRSGNLENTGSVLLDELTSAYSYSGFQAYTPGNYYAWRVSTTRHTELNPRTFGIWRDDDNSVLSSDWRIFRYTLSGTLEDATDRIAAVLNSLDIPQIRALIDAGYVPGSGIVSQGRVISGQQAAALLEALTNEEIQVNVWE